MPDRDWLSLAEKNRVEPRCGCQFCTGKHPPEVLEGVRTLVEARLRGRTDLTWSLIAKTIKQETGVYLGTTSLRQYAAQCVAPELGLDGGTGSR